MTLATRLVTDLKGDGSSLPISPHQAAYLNELRLTIEHSPTPGVMAWCETHMTHAHIVVEEGFTRLLHTIISLGISPQLDDFSEQFKDEDLFLTGSFPCSDLDATTRAALAYCGLLRETGGAYLPLVPVHSLRSSVTALWLLTGGLCFVLCHELGHSLADLEEGDRSPIELEAHCDGIAATMCMLAFSSVDEPVLGLLGLAGSLLLPKILGVVEDARFLIPPRSHPEADARAEFVEEIFREFLPDRVVNGVLEFATDREDHLNLTTLIGELNTLAWRPRATHHLANCLRPDGPIQILLSEDGVRSCPPGAIDDGLSTLCSLAISGSEELARRRTLSSYHHYASMGAELCGARPSAVLSQDLFDRAIEMLDHHSTEVKRAILKLPADLQKDSLDTYVAAAIGQHYYWSEFIQFVVPALTEGERSFQVHGVTHDAMARICGSQPPQLLLAATYRLDRNRRGDDFVLPVDEELAEVLLRASSSIRLTDS